MNSGTSIRKGAAWLFLGNSSTQLLNFLFGIVLARLLAPEHFGALLTIQVFTGLASFVAGGGMGQALVRAKTAEQADFDIVFSLQLLIGLMIYGFFYYSAPYFSEWYSTPLYTDLLRVSALSFILRPFVNVPANLLYRGMRFKEQTVINFGALLISNILSVYLASAGHGVWSLIWSGLIGSLFSAAALIYVSKWIPRLSANVGRAKDIVKYGFLVSANDIVGYIRGQSRTFILSRTLGAADVGLYNKGDSLARIPHSFITGSVYQVLFRALAAEQDDLDKCRYLYFRSITLVSVYASPLYIGILWLSEPIIRGLYGPQWAEAAGPLFILATVWPIWFMESLSGAVLAAKNWLRQELVAQFGILLLMVATLAIGVSYGINGVAMAVAVTSIFSTLCLAIMASRCIKAKLISYIIALRPAIILNLPMALVLAITSGVTPTSIKEVDLLYALAMTIAGAITYITSFLLLPIDELKTERERWLIKLKLQKLPI